MWILQNKKKEIKNFINNHDKKESYDNLLNEIETKFNISIEVDVVGIENIGQILHMLHVNFLKFVLMIQMMEIIMVKLLYMLISCFNLMLMNLFKK